MNIVFDTNVFIAALVAEGVCHNLLAHCAETHTLFTSEFVLGEVHEKLRTKFKRKTAAADETIALLQSVCTVVTPDPLPMQVCRDADDDWILATALAADAACIVTGDKDLLVLGSFQSIAILSPGEFAAFEEK